MDTRIRRSFYPIEKVPKLASSTFEASTKGGFVLVLNNFKHGGKCSAHLRGDGCIALYILCESLDGVSWDEVPKSWKVSLGFTDCLAKAQTLFPRSPDNCLDQPRFEVGTSPSRGIRTTHAMVNGVKLVQNLLSPKGCHQGSGYGRLHSQADIQWKVWVSRPKPCSWRVIISSTTKSDMRLICGWIFEWWWMWS